MPFLVFPVEIWELILEKLENSEDILNAFRAYPELEREGVLRNKKHLWLFAKIIPHVFPWLKQQEVLSCRQVCRKWSHGVDNFLENHPDKRAYPNDGCPFPGQHWIAEASPAHYSLWKYFGGVKTFTNSEMFAKFHREMAGHPAETNPFVGRSVHIHAGYREMSDDDMDNFRNGSIEFLRKFGGHIWFLEFSSHLAEDAFQICQCILESFRQVPNLKGLSLFIESYKTEDDPDFDALSYNDLLPNLPHLETLEFVYNSMPSSVINMLIRRYSTQIRRLDLNFPYWRNKYFNLFPKLTQLSLSDINSKEEVSDLLLSLNSPDLARLELEIIDPKFVIDAEILQGLQRFPRLHTLHLEPLNVRICDSATACIDRVHSLKSLILSGDSKGFEINFKFFGCFPSLEYIKVIDVREHNYLNQMNLYDNEIWDVLPKLREITRSVLGHNRGTLHYTKVKYEFLQRKI